jgi:flagellin
MDALTIENILSNTNSAVSSSLTKLSSGLKINSAADDPAGYAVANSFAAKIAAMNVASQNASEAQSMLQTADGAYSQINDILVQMKSLATEAASGQTDTADLTGEFSSLQKEITTIANSTTYGTTNLIDGTASTTATGVTFQVGATNSTVNQLSISFNGATAACLSVDASSIGISSLASAQTAMTAIDSALTSINAYMADVGATQNQLQYTINNLTTSVQNYTSSQSTIEDVNMATEVSSYTKNQILQQSAMAMLAQANAEPQNVLKLLQNI